MFRPYKSCLYADNQDGAADLYGIAGMTDTRHSCCAPYPSHVLEPIYDTARNIQHRRGFMSGKWLGVEEPRAGAQTFF